jgi:hypothetical protein
VKVIKIYLKSEKREIAGQIKGKNGKMVTVERTRPIAVPSKKNQQQPLVNKKTGKAFLIASEQYSRWRKMTSDFWDEEWIKLRNAGIKPLPITRCKVNIIFYFADDRSKDCTNKAETIMDALVEHQIIYDDSFQVVSDVSLKGYLCKDQPRTEVYITILEENDPGYQYDITDYTKLKAIQKQNRATSYQLKKNRTTPH